MFLNAVVQLLTGIANGLINSMPIIIDMLPQIIEGIYRYNNSALGIMESIANDYSSLDLDATEIQKKIGDPNNLKLLKQVLSKLG